MVLPPDAATVGVFISEKQAPVAEQHDIIVSICNRKAVGWAGGPPDWSLL